MGESAEVTVTIAGCGQADELRSLYQWLAAETELRGRVRWVEGPPRPGALGSVPEALTIVLAPGGVAAVLASAAVAWVRHRAPEVTCKLTRPDGASAEVSARRVRGTDLAGVRAMVAELSATLDGDTGTARASESGPTSPPAP